MAGRSFTEFQLGYDKAVVHLYARVNIGATGAATLQKWSGSAYSAASSSGYGGIKSITRSSAGKYVVTLQDNYNRLLTLSVCFWSATGAVAAPVLGVLSGTSDSDVTSKTTPKVTILVSAAAAGTGTDPASGEVMFLHFRLQNSSAP